MYVRENARIVNYQNARFTNMGNSRRVEVNELMDKENGMS